MQDMNARTVDAVLDEALDGPALETKAAGAAGGGANGRGADVVNAIAKAIDRQTTIITGLAKPETKAQPPRVETPLRQRIVKNRALAEMRETHERNQGRGRDVLNEQKQRRINDAMNGQDGSDHAEEIARLKAENADLRKSAARPQRPVQPGLPGGASLKGAAFATYRKAMDNYLRTGETSHNGRSLKEITDAAVRLDTKAFNATVGPEGGFFVEPESESGPLEKLLLKYSPMRSLASVRSISSASLKRIVNTRGAAGRWVGEQTASGEDPTPQFAEQEWPAMTILSEPRVTLEALEDSAIDPEQMISEEGYEVFAEMEGAAFISGNGDKKPKGILGYDFVADASWAWGKVGYHITGVNGDFHATAPGDVIKRVPLSLKKAYRQNGVWLMNRSLMGDVRVMKDTTGRYLWGEGDMSKGVPNTLDGYVVEEDEQMPDRAANAHAIAFGDFKLGYQIVDRVGFQVFRNPFAAYPYVIFHMRKRVGGGIRQYGAIKTIRFSVT